MAPRPAARARGPSGPEQDLPMPVLVSCMAPPPTSPALDVTLRAWALSSSDFFAASRRRKWRRLPFRSIRPGGLATLNLLLGTWVPRGERLVLLASVLVGAIGLPRQYSVRFAVGF